MRRKITLAILLIFMAGCTARILAEEVPPKAPVISQRLITLSNGIFLVLRDSRLVKIEISDKDMSFENTVIALSPLLPHLSTSMTKTYNQYTPAMIFGASSVPMGDRNPLSWGIDIYQTLFDFGK